MEKFAKRSEFGSSAASANLRRVPNDTQLVQLGLACLFTPFIDGRPLFHNHCAGRRPSQSLRSHQL